MPVKSMEVCGLNLLILLPLLGAIVIWVLPIRREGLAPKLSLWIGLITFAIALGLWLRVGPGTGPNNLVGEYKANWISVGDWVRVLGNDQPAQVTLDEGLKIGYHVGLDPISAPLVLLTGLLVPLAVACGFTAIKKRIREYYAWLLALTAGMMGVFVARDLLLF